LVGFEWSLTKDQQPRTNNLLKYKPPDQLPEDSASARVPLPFLCVIYLIDNEEEVSTNLRYELKPEVEVNLLLTGIPLGQGRPKKIGVNGVLTSEPE
jgi:hypothetical protein